VSELAGRAALVTGASRGIGFATAAALASAGARVALLARKERALVAAVEKIGDGVLAVPGDVADSRSVREAVAQVLRAFGRLDLLVVNAAVAAVGPIETASDEDVARQVQTNLLGAVWCARAAIPALRESRGRIVFVSSDAAVAPLPHLAVYSASRRRWRLSPLRCAASCARPGSR
jgi:NAD(P)-dependent dehydrogenase (short-subunit alcohol dehydrogenase family)